MAAAVTTIAILRPGTFLDTDRAKHRFGAAELAEIAASYDPVADPAPIVIGQPAIGDPAYGWIAALAIDGDTLKATLRSVDPTFAAHHGAGRFRQLAPSLYGPSSPSNPKPGRWYLQHVAFLGMDKPASMTFPSVAAPLPAATTALSADTVPLVWSDATGASSERPVVASAGARAQALMKAEPGLSFTAAMARASTAAALDRLAVNAPAHTAARIRVAAQVTRIQAARPHLSPSAARAEVERQAILQSLKVRRS